MDYRYWDFEISKDSDYPELDILNIALNSVNEYYNKTRRWYISEPVKDEKVQQKRLKKLEAKEKNAMELVNKIKDAMYEYKTICDKLSEYESQKIYFAISLIGDKKILKTYKSENKKINDKKIKIKEQLKNALTDKNLKNVMTLLNVKSTINNNYEVTEQRYGVPNGGESLSEIVSNLDNGVQDVINQHIGKTEKDSINGKDFYDKKDYGWVLEPDSVHVRTHGDDFVVRDLEMKKMSEFNDLSYDKKIEKIQEIMSDLYPEIDKIEIVLKSLTHLSNIEKNKLRITQEAYKELSQINLEVKRVEATNRYLSGLGHDVFPKTKKMVSKYYGKLLHQQREQAEKVRILAAKSKLDEFFEMHLKKETREAAFKKVEYFEKKVEASKNIDGKPDPKVVAQLENARDELKEILNESTIEQRQGRGR